MSKAKQVREVFEQVVQMPFYAPPMTSDMAATLPPETFTVTVQGAGALYLSVGPLKKFKPGDRVKVTVERLPAKRGGRGGK
jgi:hypothetical protein